jgi:hypothetical protein
MMVIVRSYRKIMPQGHRKFLALLNNAASEPGNTAGQLQCDRDK